MLDPIYARSYKRISSLLFPPQLMVGIDAGGRTNVDAYINATSAGVSLFWTIYGIVGDVKVACASGTFNGVGMAHIGNANGFSVDRWELWGQNGAEVQYPITSVLAAWGIDG